MTFFATSCLNDTMKLTRQQEGVLFALIAYGVWGAVPLFWKMLRHLPSYEILAHRMFWSWVLYSAIQSWRNRRITLWPRLNLSFQRWLFIAAVLVMSNWGLYIWAVNSGHVIESSLGYFMNPLVNILLGVVFLKERLSRWQTVAVFFALIGVGIITVEAGHLPWVALALAITFGLYGLIKKKIPVSGLVSNHFETFILIPLAILILFAASLGGLHFLGLDPTPQPFPLQTGFDAPTAALLVLAGVITGVPLICFAEAAQRLNLSVMGFFQFISPTFQFLTGWLLFGEPLSSTRLLGFVSIWIGLAIVLIDRLPHTLVRNKKS